MAVRHNCAEMINTKGTPLWGNRCPPLCSHTLVVTVDGSALYDRLVPHGSTTLRIGAFPVAYYTGTLRSCASVSKCAALVVNTVRGEHGAAWALLSLVIHAMHHFDSASRNR